MSSRLMGHWQNIVVLYQIDVNDGMVQQLHMVMVVMWPSSPARM